MVILLFSFSLIQGLSRGGILIIFLMILAYSVQHTHLILLQLIDDVAFLFCGSSLVFLFFILLIGGSE
jgi:hypothetical protein